MPTVKRLTSYYYHFPLLSFFQHDHSFDEIWPPHHHCCLSFGYHVNETERIFISIPGLGHCTKLCRRLLKSKAKLHKGADHS